MRVMRLGRRERDAISSVENDDVGDLVWVASSEDIHSHGPSKWVKRDTFLSSKDVLWRNKGR